MAELEPILGLVMGLGLAAACGFRVFVPLLVMSLGAWSGHMSFGEGFEWMASPMAVVMFGSATALEIGGYYVPWVDNLLDTIATPAAAVAGTIVTAACISDMSPEMTWATAIIAGGGVASFTQIITVAARATSSAATAGIGNPVVSSSELLASGGIATLAVASPVLAVLALLAVLATIAVAVHRVRERRRTRLLAANLGPATPTKTPTPA